MAHWRNLKCHKFAHGKSSKFLSSLFTHTHTQQQQQHLIVTVILLASFHTPALVFEQLSLIYSLPRYLVRSFRLILPFFPTATMERIDKEGQVSSLLSHITAVRNLAVWQMDQPTAKICFTHILLCVCGNTVPYL